MKELLKRDFNIHDEATLKEMEEISLVSEDFAALFAQK